MPFAHVKNFMGIAHIIACVISRGPVIFLVLLMNRPKIQNSPGTAVQIFDNEFLLKFIDQSIVNNIYSGMLVVYSFGCVCVILWE